MLRRRHKKTPISMTSLVDVIFLLLLFFMLSSTFSKFAEVELSAASGGGAASEPPIFVQLFADRVSVNGVALTLETLELEPNAGQSLLVALQDGVTAQRLTDLLVALRDYPELNVSVLGSS